MCVSYVLVYLFLLQVACVPHSDDSIPENGCLSCNSSVAKLIYPPIYDLNSGRSYLHALLPILSSPLFTLHFGGQTFCHPEDPHSGCYRVPEEFSGLPVSDAHLLGPRFFESFENFTTEVFGKPDPEHLHPLFGKNSTSGEVFAIHQFFSEHLNVSLAQLWFSNVIVRNGFPPWFVMNPTPLLQKEISRLPTQIKTEADAALLSHFFRTYGTFGVSRLESGCRYGFDAGMRTQVIIDYGIVFVSDQVLARVACTRWALVRPFVSKSQEEYCELVNETFWENEVILEYEETVGGDSRLTNSTDWSRWLDSCYGNPRDITYGTTLQSTAVLCDKSEKQYKMCSKAADEYIVNDGSIPVPASSLSPENHVEWMRAEIFDDKLCQQYSKQLFVPLDRCYLGEYGVWGNATYSNSSFIISTCDPQCAHCTPQMTFPEDECKDYSKFMLDPKMTKHDPEDILEYAMGSDSCNLQSTFSVLEMSPRCLDKQKLYCDTSNRLSLATFGTLDCSGTPASVTHPKPNSTCIYRHLDQSSLVSECGNVLSGV